MERWKPVVGYEGHYEISDTGRCRSLRRTIWHPGGGNKSAHWRILKGRLLMPILKHGGYFGFKLSRDGIKKSVHAHRLVLEAFVGPQPEGEQCLHRNGDPADNRLENIHWGTSRENALDRIRHGRQIMGDTHPDSKLSEADVKSIRERFEDGVPAKRLAEEYGISQSTVYVIKNGTSWKHLKCCSRRIPNQAVGSGHQNAILDEDRVREIRKLLDQGVMGTVIADRFGIHKTIVSSIKLRKTWAHVK